MPYTARTRIGYRRTDTSAAGAEHIAPTATTVREQVYATIQQHGPSTADEVARHLGLSILTVRPRITELKNAGRLVDTMKRRKNDSGTNAAVMDVKRD